MIFQFLNIEQLEGIVYFISGILSTIISFLSIYAYRKRGVKKILYAVFAFAFFTFYLFFEAFEEFYPILQSNSVLDLFAASITTLVILFFFFAIIKK
jgi:hypothetical protein